MDLTQTFFEVQTFEAGIPVSRKASGNELTFTTDDVIKGTSSDDPADPGGNFDGTQTWRNFLNQQTASVGFNPTGDDFIIQNFAQGGNISLRVRDGTERLLTQDYGVTIPTTGAIRVPVGTTGEEPSPVDGQIRYDSSTNRFRGVVNGSWEDLASGDAISDVDGDTQIQVEETADEDIIRFDLGDNVTGFPAQPNALIFSSGQFTLALPTADVVATAGGAISITSGAGNTTGDGGNYLLNTGDGGASGDAGDIRLKAGDGGASAGDGGCIWIEAGEDTGGVGTTGNVFINTQTGAGAQAGSVITTGIPGLVAIYGVNVTGNLQAGNVDVWGGYSFGSGGGSVGGHVQIFGGGAGGGGETGGDVRLFGGEGDNFGGRVEILGGDVTTTGAGADVFITGGESPNSTPGGVVIEGRDATAVNSAGGRVEITGGNSGATSGVGGPITLTAGFGFGGGGLLTLKGGSGNDQSDGGAVDLLSGGGGGGGGSPGAGGIITILGGESRGITDGPAINITAGLAVSTGDGGALSLTGGLAGAAGGVGGAVVITGGDARSNDDGGDIVLSPGAGTGSGFDGAIEIPQTTAPQSATDRLYNIAGALTWNGIDLTVSVVALNDLSDVIITGPGNGDTFFFDGSDWVNTDRIIFTAGTEPQISFFDGTAGFGSVSMNDPNEISIKSGVSLNFKSTSAGAEIYGGGVIRLNFRSNSQEQSTFFAPVGAGNDALIRLEDGDVEYGHILKEGSGEFTIRNDEAGASLQLQVRNVADTFYETGIVIVSDADVQLFFNNIEMAHTVIVGSGGFEVNNTVTGGGFERVLTTADLGGVADPLTLGQIILTDTTGLDLVDNDNAFNIGTLAGQHLAFDTSNVQSKSSASTTGTLRLNVLGGNIVIGNSTFRVDMEGTAPVALDNNTNALNLGSPGAAHLAFGPAQIQAKNTGTAAAAISINSLGGNLSIGAQSGTGTVLLYDDGNLVAQTTDSGFDVLAALFDIDNSGSTAATGLRARNSEGGFEIRVDGDDTEFFQTASNAAQEDLLLKFFNDGRTEFFFNGIIEADTQLHNTDYQTSGMRVKNHQGDMVDVGFNLMPVIELDTNTTLNETHVSQMLHRDNTGAVLYTLPSGTTGAIPPVGALIMVTNENATGAHTITAAGTLRWLEGTGTPTTGTRTLAEGGVASCYHYSDTEWWIWGIGIS